MGDKDILATYRYNNNYTYAWLSDEELELWIEESKMLGYTEVEVIRIQVLEEIYKSEDN